MKKTIEVEMTWTEMINAKLCPECETEMKQYQCYECGLEYRGPISESEDMSGRRWFVDIITGGKTWLHEKREQIKELEKEIEIENINT